MSALDWLRVLFLILPAGNFVAMLTMAAVVHRAGGWSAAPMFAQQGLLFTAGIWLSSSLAALLAALGLLDVRLAPDVQLGVLVLALGIPSLTCWAWAIRILVRSWREG